MRWFVVLVLLAGCSTLPGPDVGGEEPAAPATHYSWRTNTTGPVVHDVSLLSAGGWCSVLVAATGATEDFSDTMVAVIDAGRRWMSISAGQQGLVQPHASVQVLGEEQHVAGGRSWADHMHGNLTTEPGQVINVTFAGTHLDGEAAPFWAREELEGSSAMMQIACQRPFQLMRTFEGEQVVVFSETTFSGGASAHVHGLGETGAQVANVVGLTATQRGWLYLDHRGDLLLQHVAAGAITVRTPGGEHLLVDHPGALALAIAGVQSLQHEVEEGAGRYEVEVTYASVDIMGDVQGFILGLGPG